MSASAARSIAMDYLRASLTVLVLAFHAVMAYHPFAPAPEGPFPGSRIWGAFPVVDSQRWGGFEIFVAFNDTFFMSAMFLISGLFVSTSVRRAGPGRFLRSRALRLGVPFAVAALLLAPLFYLPSFLQIVGAERLDEFLPAWFSTGDITAGPLWFIWVLLAFNVLAAVLFRIAPHWPDAISRLAAAAEQRPLRLFTVLVITSAVAFVPLLIVHGPFAWSGAGPFFFQSSRPLHYLTYFVFGVGIGACGIDRGLLAANGVLARQWALWIASALIVFWLVHYAGMKAMTEASRGWGLTWAFGFVASCATSTFAFIALFLRFARRRVPLLDSLSDNAYGMYLLHYGFVTWLQYLLLTMPLPGLVKGVVVSVAVVALSWSVVALLRRGPVLAKVI